MKLKFSSVKQPELVGYLALLNPQNVESDEVVGFAEASLRTADQVITDRKAIALELARNSSLNGPKNAEEEAKFEQIFSFAYEVVEPSCSTNHPDMFSVLEMLNEMLMKTTFLIGNDLTAADALIFSLLHSRIRALIPLNQRKYFRVLRWFLQVQNDLANDFPAIFAFTLFDLKSLEVNCASGVAPTEKAMEKLSLEEAKERKKQQKAKKSESSAAAAPAVEVPVIGRVDLRVGKIVEIEKHPNADRLYIEKVDFGEAELRTVVSGLVEHVPIDDLKERMCMFICNLKPASICKVQSTAMLLVAKNDTQGLEPLIIPSGARPGDRICVAGVEAHPDAVIKPAKEPQMSVWDEVRKELSVDSQGIAKYKDQILQVSNISDPIHSTKISNGIIG